MGNILENIAVMLYFEGYGVREATQSILNTLSDFVL